MIVKGDAEYNEDGSIKVIKEPSPMKKHDENESDKDMYWNKIVWNKLKRSLCLKF